MYIKIFLNNKCVIIVKINKNMFRIGAIVLLQEDDENERKKRQKYIRRSLRDASNPLELPSSQYVCLFKKNNPIL